MKKNIKKRIFACLAVAAALAMCVIFAGCAGGGNVEEGLPAWGDEAKLAEQAQALIDDYSARDYEAAAEACAGIGLTVDQLAETGDSMLDGLGAFESFGDAAYLKGADDAGKEYATVVQLANYAQGTAQYTVSFYEDGSVCGFFVKPL